LADAASGIAVWMLTGRIEFGIVSPWHRRRHRRVLHCVGGVTSGESL